MINCLDLLFRPGDVIELRALGKMKNVVQSGYFKDFAKLAEVIKVLDTTGEHKGIYLVLNKINPASMPGAQISSQLPERPLPPPRTQTSRPGDGCLLILMPSGRPRSPRQRRSIKLLC